MVSRLFSLCLSEPLTPECLYTFNIPVPNPKRLNA
jgi:hypothetical protein